MTSKTEISESSSQRKIDFKKIEEKWQKRWEESGLFHAPDKPVAPDAPDGEKFYLLVMFAYPSGDIHMGHFRNYIIGDAVARWQMMKGKQVVHPFGWDAFGLPAERAAIKRKLNPADWTKENIKVSRDTLKKVGISFDWSREIVTSEPDYYRWSQWIFLRMFEKGLAYRKKGLVNWCPGCNTVLANEQVNQGICERCDSKIEKRDLEQWFFKITEYADRLVDDLDKLSNWPENVKTMQREWIGRSWGGDIDFKVEETDLKNRDPKICDLKISVFTTRPDTIFGATYMAIAPESDLVAKLPMTAENAEMVRSYRERALRKTEIERGAETGEKDGVFTGVYALNPFNGEKIQIWVADYVLAGYGSGAIMGVPGHDIRDHAFASKYDIPIIQVVKPAGEGQSAIDVQKEAYPGHGLSINSGAFDGLSSADAIEAICKYAEQKGFGKKSKHFKLRDWLISRQRYWGTPIPIIHCDKCGLVKVPEDQLPVILPDISDFLPKGRSPLEDVPDFVNVDCPECGGKARRDVD
ncbi:MAG: leucine--tRNA ligase, partial [candidate division Zixibacteria bacterium]|nr:leucine--tRNA ligase [candidate division Zixibacteria bacterium]